MNTSQSTITLLTATTLALLIAIAGSQNSQEINSIPIFAICVTTAFLINWLAFIPSYRFQTEKFYDLTGSITYLSVIIIALFLSQNLDARTILLAVLVSTWAIRLGTFLFLRIRKSGTDDRFDAIKVSFVRFLNAWTLQALWVVCTSLPVSIAITSVHREHFGLWGIVGLIIWIMGFSIEIVADYQKSQFRQKEENKGKFIKIGLWARSRHPNYFGEILLWIGITIMVIPVLQGWQWIALLSPVFVILLLTRVSGIPMLEEKADKKWGGQDDYERYKRETPVLVPKL